MELPAFISYCSSVIPVEEVFTWMRQTESSLGGWVGGWMDGLRGGTDLPPQIFSKQLLLSLDCTRNLSSCEQIDWTICLTPSTQILNKLEWVLHKTHSLSSKCHCFFIFQTNTMVLLITVGLTFIWNKLVLLLPMTDLQNPSKTAGSLQENEALC